MWFKENQAEGGILIFRVVLDEGEGFLLRTEQIFAQKCHDLKENRFSAISRIASFILSEMEAKTETVKFSSFERNNDISQADKIMGELADPELIHIMVEGKDLEQTVRGKPTKIIIRTNVELEVRFKEGLRKII